MSDTVTELRRQARESTYSSDREGAIGRLADLYPDAGETDRDAIGRTLSEVATDATYAEERELAQTALDDLFRESAPDVAEYAVGAHRRLAVEGTRATERRQALDRLRRYQDAGLAPELREQVRETYLTVVDEATHEDERRRARDALAALEAADAGGASDAGDASDAGRDGDAERNAYLAVSLAERLADAVDDPEACRQHVEELRAFVEQFPVDDEAYEAVRSDLEAQTQQLEAIPEGRDGFDDERRERLRSLSERVRQLYLRAETV